MLLNHADNLPVLRSRSWIKIYGEAIIVRVRGCGCHPQAGAHKSLAAHACPQDLSIDLTPPHKHLRSMQGFKTDSLLPGLLPPLLARLSLFHVPPPLGELGAAL